MSIKIEGGGSKENVFSDSDIGMPLWNGAPLLNLIYPVGSIYWSSNNTNPGTLFGGTWTQIKDRFILAAGDSYTNGATGGAATVTLTVSNMPSHSHSFTPSGSVSSHSHSFTPSGTVGSHTHTGPSHSHSFTPSGTVGSHSHSFTPSGTVGSHSHTISSSSSYIGVSDVSSAGDIFRDDGDCGAYNATGHWRFRKYVFTGASTGSTAPSFTGTAGNTGETAPSFSGTAGNTGAAGTGNTGAATPSFTGTAGTTSAATPSFTGTAGYTGANGSGSSFSILPSYVVKYCWERTA